MSEQRGSASTLSRRAAALALVAAVAAATTVRGDVVRVAVAANFARPMSELAAGFEEGSGHRVVVSPGSSGKHLAQIEQGAPFDLFFSADRKRVERLLAEGRARPGSEWIYARGRLVLWSADPSRVDGDGGVLRRGDFHHLAVANPRLAPYGEAARETLEALGVWEALEPRLVRGESVAQAFQFVASGAAELGLVARSQVWASKLEGSVWEVPGALHRPIDQAAVLLTDSTAAAGFRRYLLGDAAAEIILRHGYEIP